MKYILQVLLALIVASGVVAGVYYYTNHSLPIDNPLKQSTTATKYPITEKYVAKTLLASLKDEDFKLFKSEKTIILEHGGKSYEFENWSSMIDREKPTLYYFDADGDKKKELLVRGVCGSDEVTGENIYNIYILNPKKNGDGYDVTILSQDAWKTILNDSTTSQISQLKNCKKTVQFSMNVKQEAIRYNEKTGIAENGYSYYARALQDDKGKYLTVDNWINGKGIYTINKKNHICAKVDVIVKYKNTTKTQTLGNVSFELSFDDSNSLYVTDKTLEFVPDKQYRAIAPAKKKVEAFTYSEKNTFKPKDSKEISYIIYSPKIDKETILQTVNYGKETNDIKYVQQLDITQRNLVLKAHNASTFSEKVVSSPEFSVVINRGDKEKEYDIAYTASLDKTKSVLTITFDRDIGIDEINSVEVRFGA